MSEKEMALLLQEIVSHAVSKSKGNYGEARKSLHELGFSDEQMVLFGFPKLVVTVLQKKEELLLKEEE